MSLILESCEVAAGISMIGAHLRALALQRCRLSHPNRPAVDGRSVRVDGAVTLRGSTVHGGSAAGAVVLVGARIGGDLDCRAVSLSQ